MAWGLKKGGPLWGCNEVSDKHFSRSYTAWWPLCPSFRDTWKSTQVRGSNKEVLYSPCYYFLFFFSLLFLGPTTRAAWALIHRPLSPEQKWSSLISNDDLYTEKLKSLFSIRGDSISLNDLAFISYSNCNLPLSLSHSIRYHSIKHYITSSRKILCEKHEFWSWADLNLIYYLNKCLLNAEYLLWTNLDSGHQE